VDDLRSVDILLVEDNPADARIVTDYFKSSKINIKHVTDGSKALDYIYQREDYENASLPDIIILDINLPRLGGMAVLKTIKKDKNLKRIPVIVFGTSGDSKEVKNTYKYDANCYIIKPLDYDHFDIVLGCIEKFWINIATIP